MKPVVILAGALLLAACGSDRESNDGGMTPVNPIEPPASTEVVLIWDSEHWDQADWQ
ncbi:hypothetical protein [Ferrimonas balearica]|uniref:hypothetical protein n=1 Tax=Ferrimonas balearica TaxID=44012 RepID=UPI001C99221D|nr:hypothetical protein [Ferrimonas balearica]MBY5994021.1 hypothetical protein [Ferrimonas balearica]